MTMPRMTGIQLAAEIHLIRPEIPILLCTGFSSRVNEDNFDEQGISALITKPIDRKKLAIVIRNLLDRDNNPGNPESEGSNG